MDYYLLNFKILKNNFLLYIGFNKFFSKKFLIFFE